jgi:1-pyrroline-2-carboxylate reductase [NAD(P)H]
MTIPECLRLTGSATCKCIRFTPSGDPRASDGRWKRDFLDEPWEAELRVIEAADVHRVLEFPALIEALRAAFGGPASAPPRLMYRLVGDRSHDVFALLPAWNDDVIGVKAFTYLPGNSERGSDVLHASVLLFDRKSGAPIAIIEGRSLTFWRTAAMTALAADYLARADAARLLVCGTGNLAPYLALAHTAIRPIREVGIWGRNREKAASVVADLRGRRADVEFTVVDDLDAAAGAADIIVCATASRSPIILGDWVRAGTLASFIGNHERDARECDTEMVVKSRVYVDSRTNVLEEAGELLIPIDEGRWSEAATVGELAELCAGTVKGRATDDEITLFKSVGTALADLAAARLVASSI